MNKLTINDLSKLANVSKTPCVSIYIPTHRYGMEVNEQKDRLVFNQAVSDAADQLVEYFDDEKDIENFLRPAYDLLEQGSFWRYLLSSTVVLIADGVFEHYTFPMELQSKVYAGDQFYLLPLIDMISDKNHFLLLTVSLKEVRLYDVTPYDQSEVNTEGLIPKDFISVVGGDYEEKSLQFHTANPRVGSAIFHGGGAGKDDRNDELRQFFRAIDKGLNQLVPDNEIPLVLACVDEYFGEYKKVNNYDNIANGYIQGNPDEKDVNDLRKKGWEVLEEYTSKQHQAMVNNYRELNNRKLTHSLPTEVIPAAVAGKVDTLFVQQGAEQYGTYDEKLHTARMQKEPNSDSRELLNFAAIHVFDKKGRVLLLDKEQMPQPESVVNAIYRY